MLRNHMIGDPESTPSKDSVFRFDSTAQAEDPWYTNSGNDSPIESKGYNNNYGAYNNMNGSNFYEEDYENEPPLLEELGIRFDHIYSKTHAVMYPTQRISEHILDDADLAGPLVYCLLLGSCLLLAGKVQFGYIYGFSVFGCLGMQAVINLMHPIGLDLSKICSVLGYCLIPVIALAIISIIISLKGIFGFILAAGAIGWSTFAASRLFDAKLGLSEIYWLIAYPTMLLYSCFVIITVF